MNNNRPAPWMPLALGELNITELGGTQSNSKITDYFKQAGHGEITRDEVPWCAAFVGAMLEQSGKRSTKSLRARSYLSWGTKLAKPEFGAIAILSRGSNPNAGHVGFVVEASGSNILLLGGNQSDSVSIQPYSKSKLIGLRWPAAIEGQTQDKIFDLALAQILKLEGGWSNHPKDPGGPTNKGITLNTLKLAQRLKLVDALQTDSHHILKNLSNADIRKIYHHLYWQKAGCPNLPAAIAIMQFDAAVNHGVGRAIKFLQKSVDANIDGEYGPETEKKAKSVNPENLLKIYTDLRRSHYQSLSTWNIFGKGWLNRLNTINKLAKSQLILSSQKEHRTMTTNTSIQTQKWWGESLTVWGAIVTALSTVLPVIGPFIGLDITAEMIDTFGNTVTQLIQIIGGLTGTAMTLYGRSRATTTLTRRDVLVKL